MKPLQKLVAGVLIGSLLWLAGCGAAPAAQVSNTRVVTWTNPEGRSVRMLVMDIKNTGSDPLRRVEADIVLTDDKGNRLSSSQRAVPIFMSEDAGTSIAPGQTFPVPPALGTVIVTPPGENAPSGCDVLVTDAS